MPYIKSHSNYLLKKDHQNINDGKVYERDLLTIGALDQYARGQTPIYRSGNFIFTINDEPFYPKKPSDTTWFENDNGDTWTIQDLNGLDLTANASSDKRIELKNDFYSLRDFAYYGSCVTLVRGSITDIINRFPSEMYIPIEEVDYYYTPCGQASDDVFNKVQDLMIPLGNKLVVKEIGDGIRYSGNTEFKIATDFTLTATCTPIDPDCPCSQEPLDDYSVCKEGTLSYESAYTNTRVVSQDIIITTSSWTSPYGMTAQDIVNDYNSQLDILYRQNRDELETLCRNYIGNSSNNAIKIVSECVAPNESQISGTVYVPIDCTEKVWNLYGEADPTTEVEDKSESTQKIVVTDNKHGTISLKIRTATSERKIDGIDSITYNVQNGDVSYSVSFGIVSGYNTPPTTSGTIGSKSLQISGTYTKRGKRFEIIPRSGSIYGVNTNINVKVDDASSGFTNFSKLTIIFDGTPSCTIEESVFARDPGFFTVSPTRFTRQVGTMMDSGRVYIDYNEVTVSAVGKANVKPNFVIQGESGTSQLSGYVNDLTSSSYTSVTFFILSNYSLHNGLGQMPPMSYKVVFPTAANYDVKFLDRLNATYKKYYWFHNSSTTDLEVDINSVPYIDVNYLKTHYPQYFEYEHISQSGITVGSESISVKDRFYGVKNPFMIDTTREYATKSEIDENPLKYFNVVGWEKYDIINASGDVEPILAVEPNYVEGSSIFGEDHEKIVGDLICETYISGVSGTTLQLSSFVGNNNIIKQLIPFSGSTYEEYQYRGYHIRPKYEYYVDFIDSLDSFQKILMSLKTEPIYKATFETISEGNVAYENRLVDYIFPLDDGNYNLDIQSMKYMTYLSSLVNIATYYDERFSDNIYRNMTHESIKNMDWSYRTPNDDNADDYDDGETRVAQLIRLFGREFDEIKYYIDNIKNANTISYNDINNTPNYFLSDNLELKGWDIQQAQFEYLSEYFFNDNGEKIFREIDYSANTFVDTSYTYVEEDNIVSGDGKSYHLNRLFSQIDSFVVCPYYSESNGYFVSGDCSTDTIQRIPSNGNTFIIDDMFGYHDRVKSFSSDYCYTPNQVNNEFIKRLILSSKSIFSRKGTIESIEELLALFGLRSKQWISEMNGSEFYNENLDWDFDIIEYSTYSNPILDIYNEYYDNNFIDFINSTKEIPLHETEYTKYEGLPISFKYDEIREGETSNIDEIGTLRTKNVKLYPYFAKDYVYDDNLYYQSSGGWLIKEPFQMTKDNNIRTKSDSEDCGNYLYTETMNTIRYVKTMNDLLEVPFSELRNGVIVEVEDLSQDYVVIDDQLFKIEKENWGSGVTMFFTIECGDKSLYFGNHSYYYDEENGITWYSEDEKTESSNTNNVKITSIDGIDNTRLVNIPTLSNGEKIKVYIENDYFFNIGDFSSETSNFLIGGNYDFVKKQEGKTPTSYFRLEDVYGNYKIGHGGWMQIYMEDEEYKAINTITETSFGNNPHNGNMRYDCGYDYIDHFDKLFKLPYNDNLIDERCYKSYYDEIINDDGQSVLPLIGFKGIKCNDDDCVMCYKEYIDTKIHDFCDIVTEDGIKEYYDKPKYGSENTRHLNEISPSENEPTYEDIYNNISKYTSDTILTYDGFPITSGLPIDDNTNQIVNLKRVDLVFNMEKEHVGEYLSKNYLEAYHYIDNVIMKYVEQVIPSNVIMKVVYKNSNG